MSLMSLTGKIKGRLVVLDDDHLAGKTIERTARFAGMEARHCETAKDFFSALDDWQPDVVVVDLIMPDMDGMEVLMVLAQQETCPAIILSSGVDTRVLEAAKRSAAEHGLPVRGVLHKPFSPAQLKEMLRAPLKPVPSEHPEQPARPAVAPDEQVFQLSAQSLLDALEQGQLCYYYQPKVDALTHELIGFEALARWSHPALGMIQPDAFIPVAEQEGLVSQMTLRLFEHGVAWFSDFLGSLKNLKENGRYVGVTQNLTLSINISVESLADADMFDRLQELCEQFAVPTSQILFELTESCAIPDKGDPLQLLTRLRMKGFQLAIDDFGTGYSSMQQLVRLPYSELKIDKSFVQDITTNPESRAIVRSMTDLAHNLGLNLVAEGVEDEDSSAFLHNIGCDVLQGYLIARPMPGDGVMDWFHRQLKQVEQRRHDYVRALGLLDKQRDMRWERVLYLGQRLFEAESVEFCILNTNKAEVVVSLGQSLVPQNVHDSIVRRVITTGTNMELSVGQEVDSGLGSQHFGMVVGLPIGLEAGMVVGALLLWRPELESLTAMQRKMLGLLGRRLESALSEYGQEEPERNTLPSWEAFYPQAEQTLGLLELGGMDATLMIIRVSTGEDTSDDDCQQKVCQWLLTHARRSDLAGQVSRGEFVLLALGSMAVSNIARRLYQSLDSSGCECLLQCGSAVSHAAQPQTLKALIAEARTDLDDHAEQCRVGR
ncbi:Nitrogen regulation protein NR(I) [Saliniradius amylolyticus]|uniref:Nitrogen regulation protein NR(I) n=1 Tax=Saliniradius amylolyticus TaxID=2183582 RepID=A0A2S2E3F4_9ALTE|nr:EAL domain-containing response regulator [Saliniradius amylolyticus]AWL12174.1 Nitrogen regulation protein NR(I) [Saliniradius amylolyticus]